MTRYSKTVLEVYIHWGVLTCNCFGGCLQTSCSGYLLVISPTNISSISFLEISFIDRNWPPESLSLLMFHAHQLKDVHLVIITHEKHMAGITMESNDHLQDNTEILHTPHDNNVTLIVPLHPTCNPIKREITHMKIQEFVTSYPPRKETQFNCQLNIH
jgi:hypothetical protein